MRRIAIVACLLLASSGCASAAKDLVRKTTPEVTKGAIEGLTDRQTQEALALKVDPKLVQEGTKRVTSGALDGTLDTLSEPEREARIRRLSMQLTNDVLVPTISSTINGTLDSVMTRALGSEAQGQLRKLIQGVVGDVIAAVIVAARSEVPSAEDTAKTMGLVTREISKQAALGFQDALDQVKHERETGEMKKPDGGLLSALSSADSAATSLKVGAAGAGLLGILAFVALAVAHYRKSKAHRLELEERDAALMLLAESIKATESSPWGGELRELLKDKSEGHKGSEYLHRLLAKNRDLRLARRQSLKRAEAEGNPMNFGGRPSLS